MKETEKALSSKIQGKCRCISAIGGRAVSIYSLAYWLFHALNGRLFSKIHESKTEKSLYQCCTYLRLSVEPSDAFASVVTDRRTDRQTGICPKSTEVLNPRCSVTFSLRKTSFNYLVFRRRLAACRLGVACVWVVCVRTHMRVVKMAAMPVPYEQENALALQRSSFREIPTYFLTSIRRWVCELVLTRSMTGELSSHITDRMTDRQTDPHDNYRNPRCACAPRVNDRQTDRHTRQLP